MLRCRHFNSFSHNCLCSWTYSRKLVPQQLREAKPDEAKETGQILSSQLSCSPLLACRQPDKSLIAYNFSRRLGYYEEYLPCCYQSTPVHVRWLFVLWSLHLFNGVTRPTLDLGRIVFEFLFGMVLLK